MDKSLRNDPPKGKPFRSKLLPYALQIAHWQRQGKSYKEMAALLKDAGLAVHPDTINSFVLVRARGGGKMARLPDDFVSLVAQSLGPDESNFRNLKAGTGSSDEKPNAALIAPNSVSDFAGPALEGPRLSPSDQLAGDAEGARRGAGNAALGEPKPTGQLAFGTDLTGQNIPRNKPFKGQI